MKVIFKHIFLIVTILSFVSLVGCGGDDDDGDDATDTVDLSDLEFVNSTWQIVSLNGEKFVDIFTSGEPEPGEPESESDFEFVENSWVFDDEGMFSGALKFKLSEHYTDPVSSLTFEIAITSEGEYTVEDTTLKVIKQEMEDDVVATLEPKEVWEQQIERLTVEEFEKELAAESKKDFEPTTSAALFEAGSEYTWLVEGDTLTLSIGQRTIVFERKTE